VARDPDSIRRAAHDILAQPQFRTPSPSALERARHWVGQQLARALDDVLAGHLTLLGAIVLVAVVAALVALVVRAIRGPHGTGALHGPPVTYVRRPPADWLAEAAGCEASGDWRGALRARYRALVAELARRGLVDEIPGRTTGEYRAELTVSVPGSAATFSGATDLFELAVYGHADVGPGDAAELKSLANDVLAGAR
jgi:hypothetical protein